MSTRSEVLDDEILARLRARLDLEHGRLTQTVLAIERNRSAGAGRQDPGDSVDQATFGELGDTDDELLSRSRRQLVAIEYALDRMDAGTYGVSERTGRPIPLARLEAMPWATEDVEDTEETGVSP